VQGRLQQGEMPAQQILEGVMLAVAGVLLLTPGFMTDALGMLVLLPAPRAMIAKKMMEKMVVTNMSGGFHAGGQAGFGQSPFGQDPFNSGPSDQSKDGNTFEGEFEKKDDDNDRNRLN
ncbi:membrane protein FxsA, partial [Vibrio splendidus]